MNLKNILAENFTVQIPEDGHKLDIYKCNHCDQRYARHTTRMGMHLLNCLQCPKEVRDSLRGKVNGNQIISLNTKNPILWSKISNNFERQPPDDKRKLDTYTCKHCFKKYSRNATRMHIHLLKCKRCPSNIQQMLALSSKSLIRQTVLRHRRSKRSKEILEESFTLRPAEVNQKLDLFQCKYCSQKYAKHTTRMSLHLIKCSGVPISVKQAFQQKTSKTEGECVPSKKKSMLKFKKLVDEYFTLMPRQDDQKLQNVMCKYCSQKYARHATRMSFHLLKCYNCPPSVKEHVKKYFITTTSISNTKENSGKSLTKREYHICQDLLAKAIYASGAPLTLVESKRWLTFFHRLSPFFQLPTKHQLATTLLDKSYQDLKLDVQRYINNANGIGVKLDSSSIENDNIINIIINIPEPIFYKNLKVENGEDSYLYDQITQSLEDIGTSNVLGVCAQKSVFSKGAFDILQKKFVNDNVAFYFCNLQSLNSIIKLLTEQPSVDTLIKQVTTTIKHLQKMDTKSISLNNFQKICDFYCKLELPSKTQMLSYLPCLESFFNNKNHLQTLCWNLKIDEIIDEGLKNIIENEEFWDKLVKVIYLIKPIEKYILYLKSGGSKICDIPEIYSFLKKFFLESGNSKRLSISEMSTMVDKIQEEAEENLHAVHYAANILNPNFKGENLNQGEFTEGTALISKLSRKFNIPEDDILIELANYNSNQGMWSESYVRKSISLMSSLDWWKGVCQRAALSKIACAILELPCISTSSIEKKPNVKEDADGKIAYLYYNFKLLDQINQSKNVEKIVHSTNDLKISIRDIEQHNEEYGKNFESNIRIDAEGPALNKDDLISISSVKSENCSVDSDMDC